LTFWLTPLAELPDVANARMDNLLPSGRLISITLCSGDGPDTHIGQLH
jgi:hypothetical protein